MLVIREEQYKAFAQYVVKGFEDRVVIHLKQVWPDDCKRVGERGLREAIRKSFESCEKYGIKAEYDVVRFVDLTFILCQGFDTNPRLAWAARLLNDKELSPRAKMDKLWEMTEKELISLEVRQAKRA
ncbi:MAG: uncharacterized protein JWQ71_139 [Pedosphaera sp.]|nr:uncharacterized protein [Pedosphaera sp.]